MLLNDYVIIEKRIGNFSNVSIASKKGSKDYFIITETKKNYGPNFKEIEKIWKDINHPNIIKLIDTKEDSDFYYTISEHCNGGNLNKYLMDNQQPLSEEVVQYIMKQVLNAIKYLHNKKIVHRDIVPENLLINYESEEDLAQKNILKSKIKLIGLELSTYLEKGNSLKDQMGNVNYVAPELLLKQTYDEKVDIWSLGVLCTKLLINELPYNGRQLRQNGNETYYLPETLSKEAVSFINCMLQFEPKKRKDADELLMHEFLEKDVKNFTKINIKDINEHIDNLRLKIDMKDNEWVLKYFGWGIDNNENK